MEDFSRADIEKRKRMIFDNMSSRGQRRILKIGYDNWNPFQDPKDPIEIRRDSTDRTLSQLVSDFFSQVELDEEPSAKCRQGVLEMALGMINKDDRYIAMFKFACWYKKLLKAQGLKEEEIF